MPFTAAPQKPTIAAEASLEAIGKRLGQVNYCGLRRDFSGLELLP